MKIAYFGNFLDRGEALAQWGAGYVILSSTLESVERIDVYCPKVASVINTEIMLEKIRILGVIEPSKPMSILNAIGDFRRERYDRIVFNLIPTTFGKRNGANLISLILPVFTRYLVNRKVSVFYHNSVITNDPAKLGYTGVANRIRKAGLRILETLLFKTVKVNLLLKQYKDKVDLQIGRNKTKVFSSQFLEGIPTLALNSKLNERQLIKTGSGNVPSVLFYGLWGPQKALEFGLKVMGDLRNSGIKFTLTLAGPVNGHFPSYSTYYSGLVKQYSGTIDTLLGFVPEKDLFQLMMETDMVLLPYNAPGGQSGVLEIASLFNITAIAFDFPEYREKSMGRDNVVLCAREEFTDHVRQRLVEFHGMENTAVDIHSKIALAKYNIDADLAG